VRLGVAIQDMDVEPLARLGIDDRSRYAPLDPRLIDVRRNERIIPETVEAMREFDLAIIAPGHCTGWRAVNALANAFGDSKLAPLAVGKRYLF